MKRLILLVTLFSVTGFCFAQGDEYYGESQQYYQQSELLTNPTVQPPDVAAFQKVNFVPVSNYTGRANISIPIYTITSGNISVPISISYNSSGVKVNDIPSSVGSNWSLNAGGVISKVVRGMDDFHHKHNHGFVFDFDHYCGNVGFLYEKYHVEDNGWWGDGDAQPDTFIVSAPGLNTRYTHNSNSYSGTTSNGSSNDIYELTGQQNRIVESIGAIDMGSYSSPYETLNNGLFIPNNSIFGIDDITITSTAGLEYTFDKIDISNISRMEQKRNVATGQYDLPKAEGGYKIESYHLSKLKDVKTNKEVTFEYQEYTRTTSDPIDSEFSYVGGSAEYYMDPLVDMASTVYPKINRLTKIVHEQGSVEFIYGQNRQDVTDEKALTQILIKDINGNVIKKFNMAYSYISNPSYTSSNLNKRLQLDEVYTSSTTNNNLNKYKLTYNATKLPPRGSWGKDFLGYHNGTHFNTTSTRVPKVYIYPDQGLNTFLPFSIGGTYHLTSGHYSLASNLTYAKAGILEKIEYPTGGFSEFTYELNQFKMNGTTINGGGLRIQSQKIKDENGNEQILDYEYEKTDNSSSGTMVSMPNFVDFRVNMPYSGSMNIQNIYNHLDMKVYRLSQTQAEFTHNSFVGYSRVIVKNRINNGWTEYTYNSPESHPDLMHQSSPNSGTKEYVAKSNGKRSSTLSKEVYRGQLMSTSVYNSSGQIQRMITNTYGYKKFSELSFTNNIQLCGREDCYAQDYSGEILSETIKVPAERYLLTQSVTTNYLDGGNTSVTKTITYDANYPLVTESITNDGLQTIKNTYYYPHSSTTFTNAYMSTLRGQNRYSEMIKQEAFNNSQKIFTELIKYYDFGNGIYLPNEIETAKGSEALEVGATITKRDSEGNILEYKTKGNVYTSFVYGFGNSVLLAKIENAQYTTVESKLPVSILQLQNLDSFSDEATLQGYFDTVRNQLQNAKVVSYTYIPSVGVSTITDNRGKRVTYTYDEFHRLSFIKDQDDNIVKRYQYNYKNQ